MGMIWLATDSENKFAWLKLTGRVTFENGAEYQKSGTILLENDPEDFFIDLSECTFMDSTTMGVTALLANIYKKIFKRNVSLINCNQTVKELLTGLGIFRIVEFVERDKCRLNWIEAEVIADKNLNSKTILDAHQHLMTIDEENIDRFQAVVSFLEKEI